MKLKFPISGLRSPIGKKSAGSAAFARRSRSGIALIITLILLSVTLIMAVAFLAISNRERASVTTTTDTANARLATDAALASAEAQIVANALAGGTNSYGTPVANPYNFGLLVSTNYINTNGFSPASVDKTNDPANVNYSYTSDNSTYNQQDFLQNLANLYYLPRAPVYIAENSTNDFRYYLDLNRNGRFDDSGMVPNVVVNGTGITTNGSIFQMGDPQWIGLLEHPGQPYGPNNKFIARFAFIAVPIGNALDLNAIHNQIRDEPEPTASSPSAINTASTLDGFFRNQGVGSWEINLAAFLTDLNTNEWDNVNSGIYEYNQANPPTPLNPQGASANSGAAFDDARTLLAYRYSNNYFTLASVSNLFSPNSLNYTNFFVNGSVDGYSDLPLQTNFDTNYTVFNPTITWSWAGADNTNHFFDQPDDLFDTTKTRIGVTTAPGNDFSGRLLNAGTNSITTYDRYTFYRLLSQLGTDSSPESGMMNLNYDNIDYTNNSANPTNFRAWTPIAFFTNAADRMLKMYTALWATNALYDTVTGTFTNGLTTNFVVTFNMTSSFGITNIPVLVSNRFVYTPAVNRLLQLAANLYDATTTNYYPSVFRPLFTVTSQNNFTNVFITGYTNVVPTTNGVYATPTGDPQLAPPIDLVTLINIPNILEMPNLATNVYGVPWIIGAKKGFPNFNEFVGENMVGMTRRLQFVRNIDGATNSQPTAVLQTNQMYIMSLNTSGGLDFWNSYTNNFPDNVIVDYRALTWLTLTNSDAYQYITGDANGNVPSQPTTLGYFSSNSISFSGWSSSAPWIGGQPNANSFYVPLNFTNFLNMSNAVYRTPFAADTPYALPSGFTGPSLIWTNYFGVGPLGYMDAVFETNVPVGLPPSGQPQFYVPQWGLLTTNQLQVYVLDKDLNGNYHVIDYVHLEQAGSQNLNSQIFSDDDNGIWNAPTNVMTSKQNKGVPYGIYNQIQISEGLANVPTEDGTWQGDPEAATYSTSIPAQQADFKAFFYPYGSIAYVQDNNGSAYGSNFEATAQAPYAPTRYAVGYTFLEANDPLVHYLASDMSPSIPTLLTNVYNNNIAAVPPPVAQPFTLGQLNYNFQPWGGNPYNKEQSSAYVDQDAYDLMERDSLAYGSDDWDFPTNKLPTVGWIGRVHRGTPWQTVYMKSQDILSQRFQVVNGVTNYIGPTIWAQWTGDTTFLSSGTNALYFDAENSSPAWDRLLFDLFTTGINDNATRGQLSVNAAADQYDPVVNPAAGLAAWSAIFSGVVIPPTNSITNYYTITPAGILGPNSALGYLVKNINYTRNTFTNLDGLVGTFEHKGDILATPALTYQSPFLDLTQTNWNSDEMYEWLPQQIMSLVRGNSTPRYVIYAYGQTLKPAPNGIYTGGATLLPVGANQSGISAFGMITNYQVTAESATRVVIRIDGVTDANGRPLPPQQQQPHAVVESFNVLPPD